MTESSEEKREPPSSAAGSTVCGKHLKCNCVRCAPLMNRGDRVTSIETTPVYWLLLRFYWWRRLVVFGEVERAALAAQAPDTTRQFRIPLALLSPASTSISTSNLISHTHPRSLLRMYPPPLPPSSPLAPCTAPRRSYSLPLPILPYHPQARATYGCTPSAAKPRV